MPNIIWVSQSKVKEGRAADATERGLRLAKAFKDAGAVSARYFQSNAGAAAPSRSFVAEFTSWTHYDEVTTKVQEAAASWFQEAYGANTNEPSTQVAQGFAVEIEG